MQEFNIVDFTQYRANGNEKKERKRNRTRKKGSVYGRNGKLWVDFRYLG